MTTETREDLMLPNYSETELNSNVTNAKLSKKKMLSWYKQYK